MTCCCFKSKCCIYSLLIEYILINISILIVLLLSCYDISILNFFQATYLILSILNWIILSIYSICKIIYIFLGKFSQEYSPKKLWKLIHLPGFIIVGIALIYDLFEVPSKSGVIGLLMYYLFFFLVCMIFIILSFLDYCAIDKQLELSQNKSERFPLNEELEMGNVNSNDKKIN